jgi:uncharacterized repeat protein (TIGR03803 family)
MRSVTFVLLAGMATAASVQSAFAAEPAKTKEKVLHSFGSGTDGQFPAAGLVDVSGTLYGTTGQGGANCEGDSGCGTVFSINPKTGKEKVLYSFCSQQNCADGAYPANLINVKGTLYGTTNAGGASGADCPENDGCGTVFAFEPGTGAERVLYSFCNQQNCADGWDRYTGGVIDVKGILYGTTDAGGANCQAGGGCGTIFALNPKTGDETVLYSFCGLQNCADGETPLAGLLSVGGVLYGTTFEGGACQESPTGCGTVFALNPETGTENVVYSFCSQQDCADGYEPFAGLIDVKGTLYGTTSGGGTSSENAGTVFAVDPVTGTETAVYSFCSLQNCEDGNTPHDTPIYAKGILYGTTQTGGVYSDIGGTAFAIDLRSGVETVLHSFGNDTDGEQPIASLFDMNGTLYGTTVLGGANCRETQGCGTVFALKP